MLDVAINITQLANRLVVAGILITAFALIIYIALYNRRSAIGRGFGVLLACVIAAYFFDLLAQLTSGEPELWQRLQWLGIALMPAAVLGLSDTLLRATADIQPNRRIATRLTIFFGAVVAALALFSSSIVQTDGQSGPLPHMAPGELFFLFSPFYFAAGAWSIYNVVEARRRSLTTTSRRRMTYFALAFSAPLIGVFPYLLPTGWPAAWPAILPWAAILIVNMTVGAAITFMGYTVAYFGAGAPDRVVKRRLIKYLIRGPLLAVLVIAAIVIGGRLGNLFKLDGTYLGMIASVSIILLMQLYINTFQPTMDRLLAGEDSAEVSRLQSFSDRLMTTSDRQQYLENILAAMCDLLRSRTAFIMQIEPVLDHTDAFRTPLLVTVGQVDLNAEELQPERLRSVILTESVPVPSVEQLGDTQHSAHWHGYLLMPLLSQQPEALNHVLGVIGLVPRNSEPEVSDEERDGVRLLVQQAARTLEDGVQQARAFSALERMVPDAREMTRRISNTRNAAAPTLADFEIKLEGQDDLAQLVRDALSQYWGGPKLAESPLVNLQVVSEAMHETNGNATKALRVVLTQAIERLKPGGQRSFTAAEWMLYNILEMKVMQGQKVRDVATKLFMSESDLYRKQRSAFEEVARVVTEMEREARLRELRSMPTEAASEVDGIAVR